MLIFKVPNPPKSLAAKKPAPLQREPITTARKRPKFYLSKGDKNQTTPGSFPLVDASCNNQPNEIKLNQKIQQLESKAKSLKRLLGSARVTIHRLKRRLSKVNNKCDHYRKKEKQTCSCQKLSQLPESQKRFIESQLKAYSQSSLGMRWSPKDKMLALAVYYKSPAAYRFMQKNFSLPSLSTLRLFISQFSVNPGFNSGYVSILRERVSTLPASERHAVLSFDGMAIKSFLKYMENEDHIKGFRDFVGYVNC